MSKRLANILLGMFLFVFAVNYWSDNSDRLKQRFGLAEQKPAARAVVSHVLSGDTFVLSNGLHVHFVAMQAPRAKECGGAVATGALEELLPPGTKVILRADTKWPNKDQKTLLRHVWLEDGRYLPEVLGQNGMLVSYVLQEDMGDEKTRNQNSILLAKQNKAGIWADCDTRNVSNETGARTKFKT